MPSKKMNEESKKAAVEKASAKKASAKKPDAKKLKAKQTKPTVGIIMGSKSDEATMQACAETLDEFGVAYEVVIASAHRNPDKVHTWASKAKSRGVKVIIAAAGKAAHLPGVVAAYTPLPVIGVPMKTSDLGGMDSLLSIVQMPSGIPVATVAINGAKNAAILATQILALTNKRYEKVIDDFRKKQAAA
jgi:5-(carboxyamino)imidazole ribonucleotide mutase